MNAMLPTIKSECELAAARARILDAAIGLFAQHDCAAPSIRDIARAAEVNPAAISYYFRVKIGLYRAAVEIAGRAIALSCGAARSLREIFTTMLNRCTMPGGARDGA
ncbi:MAG: TetR family transcriptional regulator [Pseudomonadota bacterium]